MNSITSVFNDNLQKICETEDKTKMNCSSINVPEKFQKKTCIKLIFYKAPVRSLYSDYCRFVYTFKKFLYVYVI